ncbi:hypothetical protein K1719_046067 [Acacia pycnantha]|nr:hypothetical protein K1719_046067 [Acacia pycnantha]
MPKPSFLHLRRTEMTKNSSTYRNQPRRLRRLSWSSQKCFQARRNLGREEAWKGGNRFWKSIGLGFKTPREAIEGTYIDKCPFTGSVSIRGRVIAGTCHSAKMTRTIIVGRNYLHFVKKYQRYEKRRSNIPAHMSPCFRVKGDYVIIGRCRPLSKTVRPCRDLIANLVPFRVHV